MPGHSPESQAGPRRRPREATSCPQLSREPGQQPLHSSAGEGAETEPLPGDLPCAMELQQATNQGICVLVRMEVLLPNRGVGWCSVVVSALSPTFLSATVFLGLNTSFVGT